MTDMNNDAYLVVYAVVPVTGDRAAADIIADFNQRGAIMQTTLINPIDISMDDEFYDITDHLSNNVLRGLRDNGFRSRGG